MPWRSERVSAADGCEVACWDLDSTVRSTLHRQSMIPEVLAGRKTWDDYSLACADDTPLPGSVRLMYLLRRTLLNFAVSGASDAALPLTIDWADKHDVPIDDYILRPAGDRTENGVWKVACIRRLQAAGLKVVLFLEDWAPAAKHIWEETGVPVLGVNPFDPDTMVVNSESLARGLGTVMGTSSDFSIDLAKRVFDVLEGKQSV